MRLPEFERLAHDYWEEIPGEYRTGIDGLRVVAQAKEHPELPGVFTMGECVTEAYPSDFGSAETTRSVVVLYYGSFRAQSVVAPDGGFDWEGELWETLTHELQHHLESLAAEDALEDVDYAADENFKRYEGQPFDPTFYRAGAGTAEAASLRIPGAPEPLPLTGWRIETDWFFELPYAPDRPPSGAAVLAWAGARHAFELPVPGADVTFVVLGEGFEPRPLAEFGVDEVCIVLVRRAGVLRAAVAALLGRAPSAEEVVVEVRSGGDGRDD